MEPQGAMRVCHSRFSVAVPVAQLCPNAAICLRWRCAHSSLFTESGGEGVNVSVVTDRRGGRSRLGRAQRPHRQPQLRLGDVRPGVPRLGGPSLRCSWASLCGGCWRQCVHRDRRRAVHGGRARSTSTNQRADRVRLVVVFLLWVVAGVFVLPGRCASGLRTHRPPGTSPGRTAWRGTFRPLSR